MDFLIQIKIESLSLKWFSLSTPENLNSILQVDFFFFLQDETDASLIPDMVIYGAGFYTKGKSLINCH